jgi:predicted Zn-dependent protease
MNKWLGVIMLLSSMLTIQACAPKAQDDCGFVQNVYGERISWKGEVPVTMMIHTSVPDAYVPAIVAAAESWNRTAGKTILKIDTNKVAGALEPRKDGINIIYVLNTWEANKASEQARTSVYWVGDVIQEADIRINDKNFDFYTSENTSHSGVNIEALLLHELGHVLGLKHKDTSGSVMATYLANGVDRTAVTETDTAALQCEY